MKNIVKTVISTFSILITNQALAFDEPFVECNDDLMVIKETKMFVGCRQPTASFITAMTLSRQEITSIGNAEISLESAGFPFHVPDHICDNPRGYPVEIVIDKVRLPKGTWDIYFSGKKAARVDFTDTYDGSICTIKED